MLQATLASLLEQVAGRYFHVSSIPDLRVGLGGGHLVLDNVLLRAEAFDTLAARLGVRILRGDAARVRVHVPWQLLGSSPVRVHLENVSLVAAPVDAAPVDAACDAGCDVDRSHTPAAAAAASATASSSAGTPFASTTSTAAATAAASASVAAADPWHTTLLGRLGFNVAVELHGLRLEYRDARACTAVLSVTRITATSADARWQPAFAPLDPGLDEDDQESDEPAHVHHNPLDHDAARVVAMRKLLTLEGVHCTMLSAPESDAVASPTAEILPAFEAQRPIVDGISVTLKLLMCCSSCRIGNRADTRPYNRRSLNYASDNEPGTGACHVDLDVELEEPVVSLSMRQFSWLASIVQSAQRHGRSVSHYGDGDDADIEGAQYFGDDAASDTGSVQGSSTGAGLSRKRMKSHIASGTNYERQRQRHAGRRGVPQSSREDGNNQPVLNEFYATTRERGSGTEGDNGHSSRDVSASDSSRFQTSSSSQSVDEGDGQKQRRKRNSGMYSLWQAIIGENLDEAVDDPAVALGYSKYVSSEFDYSTLLTTNSVPRPFAVALAEADDRLYAKRAVATAAEAGGFTICIRLTTPDLASREAVRTLEEELLAERLARQRLHDAEFLVNAAESEAANMRNRNAALVIELADLERMARAASATKDDMIRQMEAALMKAERRLQEVAQEQAAQQLLQQQRRQLVEQHRRSREQTAGSADSIRVAPTTRRRDDARNINGDGSGDEIVVSKRKLRDVPGSGPPALPKHSRVVRKVGTRRSRNGAAGIYMTDGNNDEDVRELADGCSNDGLTLV
jgi:N-terminal region of Chorein or VPS13